MNEHGRVLAVTDETLGDNLVEAAAPAATTLYVEDASVFLETGGTVLVEDDDGNSEQVAYSAISLDDDTLTVTAITGTFSAGARVSLYPLQTQRFATVALDDPELGTLQARVPFSMQPSLPDGIRDDGAEEEVLVELLRGEWTLVDILRSVPTVDGAYVELVADQVTADVIAAEAVTADAIAAGAVTADKLEAALVLASRLIAGIPDGQRVEVDGNGVRLVTAQNKTVIDLPSAEGQEATFEGALAATKARFTDAVLFQGTNARMEEAAELEVVGSDFNVQDPNTAPSVVSYYDRLLPSGVNYWETPDDGFTRNVYWNSVYDALGGPGGDQPVMAMVARRPSGDVEVLEWDWASSGGAFLRGTVLAGYQHLGNEAPPRLLGKYDGDWVVAQFRQHSHQGYTKLHRFNEADGSFVSTVEVDYGTTWQDNLPFALDETNGLVYVLKFATPMDTIYEVDLSDGTLNDTCTLDLSDLSDADNPYVAPQVGFVGDVGDGNRVYFPTAVYPTGSSSNGQSVVVSYDPSGETVEIDECFPRPFWGSVGFDGTSMWLLSGLVNPVSFSDWTWAEATTGRYHVGYTWYNTVLADETLVSPRAVVNHKKRSKMRVSIPGDLPSLADVARVYINIGVSEPQASSRFDGDLQGTTSTQLLELSSHAASTQNPAANNFVGTNPSSIAANGHWRLSGDGEISVGQDGVILLESDAANPTVAPTFSQGYPYQLTLENTHGANFGLFYDTTNSTFWSSAVNGLGYYRTVTEHDEDTGAIVRSIDLGGQQDAWGVVRVGSFIYVLVQDWSASHDFYIAKYAEATLVLDSTVDVSARVINENPGLGTDGTDLFIITTTGTGDDENVRLQKYDDTPAYDSTIDLDATFDVSGKSGGGRAQEFGGLIVEGANYYIAMYSYNNAPHTRRGVYAFATAGGARDAASDYKGEDAAEADGIAYDGTYAWTLLGERLIKHSQDDWAGWGSSTFWGGYTWYDSTNPDQTLLSPVTSLVTRPRTWLRLDSVESPATLDADGWRGYVYYGGTQPANLVWQDESDGNCFYDGLTLWVDYLDTSSGNDPASNTFDGADPPGRIEAGTGGFFVEGDSSGEWPITRRIHYTAMDLTNDTGTAAEIGPGSPDLMRSIRLDDAVIDAVNGTFMVPSDWDTGTTITFYLYFSMQGTDAQPVVRMTFGHLELTTGSVEPNDASVASGPTDETITSTTDVQTLDWPVTATAANSLVKFYVQRAASHANDTYEQNMRVIGYAIEYTAVR
jgi:hypothetical protein